MSILVLGEDKRMLKVADEFGEKLFRDPFLAKNFDVVILPYVSLKAGNINLKEQVSEDEFLDDLCEGTTLFGGGLDSEFLKKCEDKGVRAYDLFDDEDLTAYNANLTAKGALSIVLESEDVKEKEVFVLGFGRVGKACAKEFRSAGAKLSVVARKESARFDAQSQGYHSKSFDESFEDAEIILNTVPDTVLDRKKLCECKNTRLILDLASSPYGTDFKAAEDLKIKALTAPSLPAKSFPDEAGKAIASAIKKALGGVK